MADKPIEAAIEGWFTLDHTPHLLGAKCQQCGTYYFPKHISFCRNPHCESEEFTEVPLSRSGKIWSYTNACYKPPEPFIAAEPFEPYTIAAVELDEEKMIILGQVITGVDVSELSVGDEVELVLETLHETEDVNKVTWKWKPSRGERA
jgi:uncharacterized OB-fold protein